MKNKLVLAKKFIGVFFLSFILIRQLEYWIITSQIERDVVVFIEKFKVIMDDAVGILDKLPSLPPEKCAENLQQILLDHSHNSSAIRWISFVNDGKPQCSSNSKATNFSYLNLNFFRIDSEYAFATSKNVHEAEKLYLIKTIKTGQYVISLAPLHPKYFFPVTCLNCIEYSMRLNTSPNIEFNYENFTEQPYFKVKHDDQFNQVAIEILFAANRELFIEYLFIPFYIKLILCFLITVGYLTFYGRKSIYNLINKAVKNSEFIPYYQPIINAETNQLYGAEILCRWKQRDGKIIPPNQFIPLAEANGDIIAITNIIIDKLVNDIKKYQDKIPPIQFSINIVPQHLESDLLYEKLKFLIQSERIGKHKLALEITERMPITQLTEAEKQLKKFRSLGIKIKLDDAGTGYGCFRYIQELNICSLKIDKLFVDTIGDELNTSTLNSIIAFAKKSDLELIAEGVETLEQLEYLKQKGVNLIQGYYYSAPVPTKTFYTEFINKPYNVKAEQTKTTQSFIESVALE